MMSDVLMFVGLVVGPAVITLAVGLMVFKLIERFAPKEVSEHSVPCEAERKYIRRCFPDRPSDLLATPTLDESIPYTAPLQVVPLKVKVRFRREEWKLPTAELLKHRAGWN